MVSVRDALVTIVAVVLCVLALGYVVVTPTNILFATMVPGILLPFAYVFDRRRRAGAVGLQRGEGAMLVTGIASVISWTFVLLILPVLETVGIASTVSVLSIVLVVRGWQRVARTL